MPTMLFLPWRWSGAPRPGNALVFASRFDAAGLRQGLRLLIGGIRLRRAVLTAPGALGVSLRAHPIQGRYYTLSMWRDEQSLMAFAHGPAHRRAVRGLAELGPTQGVLVSRDADPHQRPNWPDTMRWLTALDTGPYRHQPRPAQSPLDRPVGPAR
jgi:heme-degrading monooxygenase HmoA